jgi:autotransporter-associated beta strand protein
LQTSGTLNAEPSGAQATGTTAMSVNSLNLTSSATGVTMSGTGSLTLLSGGLIGNNAAATITGGTLKGSISGELIVITPQNLMIGSVIADNGGPTRLTKAGSGTLTLTGGNTYSGATIIDAGILQVGGTGALGTGTVTNDSALVFNLSGTTTLSGAISGAGSLALAGAGTLILSGSNDYTGGTTVDAGTLCVTNSSALPYGSNLVVDAGGTFVFDPSAVADNDSLTVSPGQVVVAVPEPGTLVLLAVGTLAGVSSCRREKKVDPAKY